MWKIILVFVLSCAFSHGVGGAAEDKKIGDSCDYHEECEHISHSTCDFDDQECTCMEEFVPSYDNLNCLPLATQIGDACEIQEQCSEIPLGECKSNICVVAQAVVTNSSTTVKPKEECTEDSQCRSFLLKQVCKNGTCVQASPAAPSIPVPDVVTLGKPCVNESDCSGDGVACIDKLCKCEESFVPGKNLKACLPKAKSVGDSCSETVQCLPVNGCVCENGKCVQPIKVLRDFGVETVRDKISSLLIGSTCQHDNECKHMSHAVCLENVCQCEDDYVTSVASNACLEKAKKEGDPCKIDKQCEEIKGATCIQEKCVKPGIVGTKLGKANGGSMSTISKLAVAAILFVKVFSV